MAPLVFLNSTSKAWQSDFGVLAPNVPISWFVTFSVGNPTIISSIGFVPGSPGVKITYSTTSIESNGSGGDDPTIDTLTYRGTIQIDTDFPAQVYFVGVLTVI